jgi:hypothetical protein
MALKIRFILLFAKIDPILKNFRKLVYYLLIFNDFYIIFILKTPSGKYDNITIVKLQGRIFNKTFFF